MGMLARFKDIMQSNINALLDKAENPEKMIDQQLRNLNNDLGQVKAETASVMAEEKRAKRDLDDGAEEIDKMQNYAVKALETDNETDARKFLEKKTRLTDKQTDLQSAYDLAAKNARQMREMHDKLVSDINELESRQQMIKGKMSVAKTQERLNKIGSSVKGANDSVAAFERMEEKADKVLDEANAMAELNTEPKEDVDDLMEKYNTDTRVDDELATLKEQIKNKDA